ncbi:hypothetical protein L7F22_022781 [Adiantum nelumboides]|nr:hypothetical protein [Adiantum nelumboides]
MEALKQVKSVACSGDHFARALALWVFGCLVELASDSSDVFRLILKALHSRYEHEVQGAVFALSCFCNISEHFAIIAVGHIHDLIIAEETAAKTKIQAISVFGQMSSSIVSALKAHEVELLLSYVQSDPHTVLQDSPYVKLLALQALRKLLPFCVLVSDAGPLLRVLSLMKLKASASNWSEVQPVLGFLVEVVCTMGKSRPDLLKIVNAQLNLRHGAPASVSFKNEESIYDSDFSTCAVLLVCSQVEQLDCERTIEGYRNEGTRDTELKQRCLFLGRLLVQLAQHSSHCGFVVINNISKLVETLFKNTQDAEKGECWQELGRKTQNQHVASLHAISAARSCVLKMLCRCIKHCGLFWLSQEGPSSTAFLRMTKLVAWITSASLPPHVLLDSLVLVTEVRRYMTLEEAESVDTKINFVVASFIQDKEFWYAYKAVAVAACHCLWKHSASAIGEFMHRAQSQSTFYWLKAFTDVCTFAESLQSECSLKAMQCCMDKLELKITTHCCISANLGQAIARALSSAYAAENSLAATAKQKVMFGFQRQLLSLRVAFIRTSGELLGLIAPLCTQIKAIDVDALADSGLPAKNDSVKRLISNIESLQCSAHGSKD